MLVKSFGSAVYGVEAISILKIIKYFITKELLVLGMGLVLTKAL
jgi:hypothetical protein